MPQPWNSGAISPKDALALQYFPAAATAARTSNQTSPMDNHRRTFSASSYSINQPLPLSENQIHDIEKLGVKFIHPPTATSTTTSSNTLTSTTNQLPIRPAIRRNSIVNPKRRRSIKLNSPQRIPCNNNNNNNNNSLTPTPISPNQLLDLIVSKSNKLPGVKDSQPPLLVIDLRNINSYLGPNGRLKGSINVNFPSLLIKRFLKGTPTNFQLHPFITTEAGKRYYSRLEKTYLTNTSNSSSVLEHLDICVIDDQLDPDLLDKKPYHPAQQNSFGKILLDVLCKWLNSKGRTAGLFYLSSQFEELLKSPAAQKWLLFGEQTDTHPPGPGLLANHSTEDHTKSKLFTQLSLPPTTPKGLLRLKPSAPAPSLPSIDPDNTPSTTHHHQPPPPPNPSSLSDVTTNHKSKPPKLRRIDTSESILGTSRPSGITKQPLAQLKTDAQTLSVSPKMMSSCGVHSQSNHASSSKNSFRSAVTTDQDHSSAHIAHNLLLPPQPSGSTSELGSNRDEGRTSSSPNQHSEMSFKVSTIIPSFLYLGPEPSKESDFQELNKLGVKVILNVALECNKPDILEEEEEEEEVGGGKKKKKYLIEKYYKIPLRDFVEETGIQAGIEKSNQILNHAFLKQFPTYVHCKAGKSRSVTIVLAYLIHRFRWSLKHSYAHVSERRKGVCPNIGFLAELMNFEEREIGSKSRGVTSGPMMTHKVGRSASHHYSYSNHHHHHHHHQHYQQQETRMTPPENKPEGHGEEGVGFEGYSMDVNNSHHHQNKIKSNSFDLRNNNGIGNIRHHHGIRVRSVALASKTDFFNENNSHHLLGSNSSIDDQPVDPLVKNLTSSDQSSTVSS